MLATAAPAAGAAPPANDNYLSSIQMMDGDRVIREYRDTPDTTEATVQADLFNPSRDGLPLAGGAPENTRCGAIGFGKTVWYDFLPESQGGVQILASGFDTVVAVYEYNRSTAQITRMVTCRNATSSPSEDVILPTVRRGRAYTVQVGGVGAIGGPLDFRFAFFGDRDADGVLDEEPDECPSQPGIKAAGGCPPALDASPRVAWGVTPAGVQISRLTVEELARGARVLARCRRCGRSESRRARGRTLSLRRFTGRTVPRGAVLEIFVTMRRTERGRFRFGAIGNYFRYEFAADEIRRRTIRCLEPGSRKPRRKCT